jgi:predicted regulator of Ras-like GTPase activity (Roadblock/LC7/MglB family)
MFLETLSAISNRIAGSRALCLVDRDGILVESVSADSSLDLDLLAAELVAQTRSISEDHRDLAVGEVSQLTVTTDQLVLVVSSVGHGYFLLLVMEPHGGLGRARFELRRARLELEDELAV